MKAYLVLGLISLPYAFTREGDLCTYNDIKGTCQDVSDCTAGFTVNNQCPNDPSNVKCCIAKSCTSTSGQPGICLNNNPTKCSGSFITGRCPGPNDVQCCITGTSSGTSNGITVDFWINAFIPHDVAGVTKPYPKDTSKTMINGIPIIGDCFLTDQRSFSNNFAAKARMHSSAHLSLTSSGYTWSQSHHCGETTEVDCEDGDVEDTETQNTDNMAFTEQSGSSNRVTLGFKAARNNPLVALSPNIDLMGTLTVDRVNRFVESVGKVDEFPAFEAYASINGGAPRTIGQLGPKAGAGPESLAGGANQAFEGRVNF